MDGNYYASVKHTLYDMQCYKTDIQLTLEKRAPAISYSIDVYFLGTMQTAIPYSIWRATRRLCRYSPACMKAHKELIEKHCMEREGLAMQDQKLALYGGAGVRICKCPRSVADILGDWKGRGVVGIKAYSLLQFCISLVYAS